MTRPDHHAPTQAEARDELSGARTPVTPLVRAIAIVLAVIAGAAAIAWLATAPARSDALCDAMKARFGPGYPCLNVPTNTFTPTALTAPTTPGSTGQNGGGPQAGSNIGPGPGEGNGSPIVPVPGQQQTPTTAPLPRVRTAPTQAAPGPTTSQTVPSRPSATPAPSSTPSPAPTSSAVPQGGTGRPAPAPTQSASTGSDTTGTGTQTALWLLAGAAAIVAGAASARSGSRVRWTELATRNGYPSTTAALRSWLPAAQTARSAAPAENLFAPHLAGSTYNLGNSSPPDTNAAAGDGPTHLYPGYPIGLGADSPTPTGTMQWVPESPASNHGTIEWSDTPVVPPGSRYVTQSVRITRNGQPVPAQYTFNGRTFTGRIAANAGDVITFSQQGEAVAANGSSTTVNVGGTVEPIRIPVAGQTDGGPGQWVPTNENMSHNSAYFQESVTHTLARGWSYKIGSTSYDGFYTDAAGQRRLLEAKGIYTNQMDVPWTPSTIKTISDQMAAQAQGAKGTGATLDWYLQEPSTYPLFQQAQGRSGIGNIINWHTGSQGRPN